MSAPDTNLSKQRRRHIGPLAGIAVILVLVSLLFAAYMAYSVDTETPENPATVVEPGSAVPLDETPATPLTDPTGAPAAVETVPAPAD